MKNIYILILIQLIGGGLLSQSRDFEKIIPIEHGCKVEMVIEFTSPLQGSVCEFMHNNQAYNITNDEILTISRFEVNARNDMYFFKLNPGEQLNIKFEIRIQSDIERTFINPAISALHIPSFIIRNQPLPDDGPLVWVAEMIQSNQTQSSFVNNNFEPPNSYVLQIDRRPTGENFILEKEIYFDTTLVNHDTCKAILNTSLAFINGFQRDRYVSVRYVWGQECNNCLKVKYVEGGTFGDHFGADTNGDSISIEGSIMGENILLMHEILHTVGLDDLCLNSSSYPGHRFLNYGDELTQNILCSTIRNSTEVNDIFNINMSVFQIHNANRIDSPNLIVNQ